MLKREILLALGIFLVIALAVAPGLDSYFLGPRRLASAVQRVQMGMGLEEVESILGPGIPSDPLPFPYAPPRVDFVPDFYTWDREYQLFGSITRKHVVWVKFKDGKVDYVFSGTRH